MADVWAGGEKDRNPEIGRTTSSLLRLRFVFLPVVVGITLWHWFATGGSSGRLALICAFFALMILHIAFLFRQRRKRIHTQTLGVAGNVNVLVLAALTGGLDSAFVVVLPVTATTTAMGGPRRDACMSAALRPDEGDEQESSEAT
jgi:hypothetical protein